MMTLSCYPAAFATIEEMFEMLTWLQLRLQNKPVMSAERAGYFDSLLEFLEHAANEGTHQTRAS